MNLTISLSNQSNQHINQNSFCAKYGHANRGLVQVLNGLEPKFCHGRLYRENVLSEKATSAANNLVKFIQNQSRYNMSLKQDYSRNIIQMKLLTTAYEANKGYQVLQIKELPTTSSIKSYTKTAKEIFCCDSCCMRSWRSWFQYCHRSGKSRSRQIAPARL